jgi:polyisoprenoid-binding protein YceI
MSARIWIAALLITCFLRPVFAAPEQFTLDADHTFPSLEFPHMGLSIWRGKFNRTSGHVRLDRKARTGSVEAVIDVASIDFGHDEMNKHALARDWLNVAQFPTMTYRGTLEFKGDTPVAANGQLTLRGITRPVRLSLNGFNCIEHPFYKKEACGADAVGQLDRADFGMDQYTQNGMGIITLRIQVEALKDDSTPSP